jgi:hypothetical protein
MRRDIWINTCVHLVLETPYLIIIVRGEWERKSGIDLKKRSGREGEREGGGRRGMKGGERDPTNLLNVQELICTCLLLHVHKIKTESEYTSATF